MAKEDLIPLNTRSPEEHKAIAAKGGRASGEARRRKKTLKEDLLRLLETMAEGDKTIQENMTLALIQKALAGDTKAYEIVRDTIGEKQPDVQKVQLYNSGTADEIEKYIDERRKDKVSKSSV